MSETKLIPGGMPSVIVALGASSGPLLVTVIVYGTSVSGAAVAGPVFVTERSAVCASASGATVAQRSEAAKSDLNDNN